MGLLAKRADGGTGVRRRRRRALAAEKNAGRPLSSPLPADGIADALAGVVGDSVHPTQR
jgi:hypothetical protein